MKLVMNALNQTKIRSFPATQNFRKLRLRYFQFNCKLRLIKVMYCHDTKQNCLKSGLIGIGYSFISHISAALDNSFKCLSSSAERLEKPFCKYDSIAVIAS